MPTEKQVSIMNSVWNLRVKVGLVVVHTIVYIGIIIYFILSECMEISIILAIIEGILTLTIGPIIRHYFPAIRSAIAEG